MKTIYFVLLFCSIHSIESAWSQKLWTEEDRAFDLSGLKTSQAELIDEIKDLSPSQIQFKTDSTQWSIAQIIEHLGIQEEFFYHEIWVNQFAPELPEYYLQTNNHTKDSLMLAYATDPAKSNAPWMIEPIGRFEKKEDLIVYFNRFRDEMIHFVTDTQVDMKKHVTFRPREWGIYHLRNLHQILMIDFSHTRRHISQIKRIKSSPQFPKK